jgi:hypothetical protein
MRNIRIYRNAECAKCARYAAAHRFFDWLGHIEVSTTTPRTGALVPGEVVVEKLDSGEILRGADAFAEICRQIPAYALFRLLLRVPAARAFVDRDMKGCNGNACAVAPRHH